MQGKGSFMALNWKKGTLGLIITIILIISNVLIPTDSRILAKAAEQEEFLEAMYSSASLIRRAIDRQKEEALTRIKSLITLKGYDYALTIESFNTQPDPYADANYNELIIAYATAKDILKVLDQTTLYRLPLVKEEVDEVALPQLIPVRVPKYEETGEGKYIINGYEYITEEKVVDTYRATGDGFYEKDGTITIKPEYKTVIYGDVKLKGTTAEEILNYLGLSGDEAKAKYERKLEQAEALVNGRGLGQSVNISLPQDIPLTAEEEALLTGIKESDTLPVERKYIIAVAQSLIGKVPYQWGGRASKEGYDTSWWTYGDTGTQKGLDCSGYVQWVYRTAGYKDYLRLASTAIILVNTETIAYEDLLPGDFGLMNYGEGTNHVGIFLGNGYWIHCSSSGKTVSIQKTGMFKIFKRAPDVEDMDYEHVEDLVKQIASGSYGKLVYTKEKPERAEEANTENGNLPNGIVHEDAVYLPDEPGTEDVPETTYSETTEEDECQEEYQAVTGEEKTAGESAQEVQVVGETVYPYTDSDIYLLAQLIYQEAHTEGLNGWIAVGEVVRNRMESTDFPDSVKEVIYAPRQFSGSATVAQIVPTNEEIEVAKQVLSGNLSIFNNTDVLYFRNAGGSTENWGSFKYYTSINHHQFYLGNA